jgi:hypothetical protein
MRIKILVSLILSFSANLALASESPSIEILVSALGFKAGTLSYFKKSEENVAKSYENLIQESALVTNSSEFSSTESINLKRIFSSTEMIGTRDAERSRSKSYTGYLLYKFFMGNKPTIYEISIEYYCRGEGLQRLQKIMDLSQNPKFCSLIGWY